MAKRKHKKFGLIIVLIILILAFAGTGYYLLKIKKGDLNSPLEIFKEENKIKGSFSSSIDVLDTYYLAVDAKKSFNFKFDYPSDYKVEVSYAVANPEILKVEEDAMYGLAVGETDVTVTLNDGNEKKYHVNVTDLIKPANPEIKAYLPCKAFTDEQAEILDKILDSRVKEGGEGTRGGVLAAARFLALEFPYTIRYFNENGRLVDHGIRPHIDGEGRFYHKGLYLSTAKYDLLEKGASTSSGPNIWGCNIYDRFISRQNQNGLDCSGFVTWAMYNGGFDVGDVGAGEFKQFDDDLFDLGEHHQITQEYMKGNTYKVGDFIGRDGHAALIIGISDTTVYTAESLPPRFKVYKYERYNGIVKDDNLTYVVEMSSIYPNGDGYTTDMWE